MTGSHDSHLRSAAWAHGSVGAAAPVSRSSAGPVSSFSEHLSLYLSSPLTDCMQPARIVEGNLLHSESVDLNVSLI